MQTGMTERERELCHLDKRELVRMIINYESKLEDMELEDMIEHEKKYPDKSIYYYNRQTDPEAEAAMVRYTEKLRRENAKYKINKSKRKKTTKLRKRST